MAAESPITSFACDILHNLPQKQNLAFSPLSIYSCLAMIYAGAQNKTAEEIKNVLKIQSEDEDIHQKLQYAYDQLTLERPYGYICKAANRLFYSQDYSLLSDYLNLTKKYYKTEPQSVNYSKPSETTGIINDWVEDQTANKIRNLIPVSAVNSHTKLVLVNALHFKGEWKHKFNERNTTEMAFNIDHNSSIKVKMMHIKGRFSYIKDTINSLDFQMIELPYKQCKLSMYIILPSKINTIECFYKEVHGISLTKWINRLSLTDVELFLPRFCISFATTLRDTLRNLGMHTAFNKEADFTNLSVRKDLYISEVFHKVFIEVKEDGTEAAAATASIMKKRARKSFMPKEMRVDHPFIFMIYDKSSYSVLFMGKIYIPE